MKNIARRCDQQYHPAVRLRCSFSLRECVKKFEGVLEDLDNVMVFCFERNRDHEEILGQNVKYSECIRILLFSVQV